MRTKAGIAVGALALVAVGVFAAAGLGARLIGLASVSRPGAIHAQVTFPESAGKAHRKPQQHRILYGSASVAVPIGDATVTLGDCPKKSHIVNGTLGALHPKQAKYFTIRGFGLGSPKSWFVDVNNSSDTVNPPGFKVNAIGFIVCET